MSVDLRGLEASVRERFREKDQRISALERLLEQARRDRETAEQELAELRGRLADEHGQRAFPIQADRAFGEE